jgi:tRNA(adenine34) deaminase
MCAGAIVNSRIKDLVIGAMDPKGGGCGSLYNIVEDDRLNHRVEVRRGILEEECSNIMKDFFKKLR